MQILSSLGPRTESFFFSSSIAYTMKVDVVIVLPVVSSNNNNTVTA